MLRQRRRAQRRGGAEIFQFIDFWKRTHGQLPRHLVFDSRLTTYPNLARLDALGITFITVRRRSPALRKAIVLGVVRRCPPHDAG